MKNIGKFLIATVAIAMIFTACKKEGDLPFYKTGNGTVLSGSVPSVAAPIADSGNVVYTLNWTWPNYATDSANQKFIIQIDSAGKNFVKPATRVLKGVLSTSFTAKELNTIVFGLGGNGAPYTLDIRVISSYSNNNDQYQSNTITVVVTPYLIPVTLSVVPPGPLTLLMANATTKAITCNWNKTQFGNQTLNYAIQIQKSGADWSKVNVKTAGTAVTLTYTVTELNNAAVSAGIVANTTGTIDLRVIAYQGTNYANPVYSNVIPLTVTTYLDVVKFWVVGAYNGWDNSDKAMYLKNTPASGAQAEGYVNFDAIGAFKLTTDHSWTDPFTFGDDGSNTGKLKNPGGDINVTPAGYYLIKANPVTMTYSLTQTFWGVIGSSTPGGWDTQTNMTYDATSKTFNTAMTMIAGAFKFRGTSNWDINYGSTAADGKTLDAGGKDIAITVPADYYITLDLSHPNEYTYSANRWGLIGDATGSWDNDQNMTWDATLKAFKITLDLTVGKIKFRANDDWAVNYGGDPAALTLGGADIAIATAGNYTVTLYLSGTVHSTIVKNTKKK